MAWFMLTGAILTSLAGQTLLKLGAQAPNFAGQLLDWRTLFGLCLYGLASLLYIFALRRIPMSVALPCTAAGYIATAAIGYYAFAEPVGAMHVAALALITTGVMLLALA
ncbi:MAG: multidrug transporter [Acetobacteraceae bacterium]|nr:multidrug transporter [Acetobacteraceae bacterium]MBV8524841.1 multidrug transporter [Acetobacteraceae bacterium]MBV8590350.1 multidrug transporter [Acetobacteraceae bacterium]